MKPNFALSLSFDGIRLLHRDTDGWSDVGDVSLDSADLGAELRALKETALELEPGGPQSKIIIPPEQIKYLDLPETGLRKADVRAALEGVTPYAVEELKFDFAETDGRTRVAAVAKETLEEAESFAVDHEFSPVSFVASPRDGTFPREPFFGKTKTAGSIRVNRDKTPVPLTADAPESAATEPPVPADAPGDAQDRPDTAGLAPMPEPDVAAADDPPMPAAEETGGPANGEPPGPPAEQTDGLETQDAGAPATEDLPAAPGPQDLGDTPADPDTDVAPDDPRGDVPARDDVPAMDASATAPPGPETPPDIPDAQDDAGTAPEGIAASPARGADTPPVEPGAATPDETLPSDRTAAPDSPGPAVADPDEVPADAPAPEPSSDTAPRPEAPTESRRPAPAEPVFASRLRATRNVPADTPGGTTAPPAAPRAPMSPPTIDNVKPVGGAQRPVAQSTPAPAAPESTPHSTPMPPAVAKALEEVDKRVQASPPGDAAAATGPEASVPPATPPPPAVSKALKRMRKDADLPRTNGTAPVRPIPGAGPQASVSAAPPGLPAAAVRTDVPPPPDRPRKTSAPKSDGPEKTRPRTNEATQPLDKAGRPTIPAPPAGVAASMKPTSGPDGAPSAGSTAGHTDTEKERLTVFGARKREREARGKPRFLGLILTVILLLMMAAVAAWAALPQGTVARWLGLDAATATATAETDEPAAATDAPPATSPASSPPTGEPSLDPTPPSADPAPAPDPVPDPVPEPESQAVVPTALPATQSPDTPGAVPAGDMLLSETGSLLPGRDLLRALAAPTPADAVNGAPGSVLSPAAAERFYAATGVWLRAPRLPLEPTSDPLGRVARVATDAPPDLEPMPELTRSAPDTALMVQPDPPPPDMQFERDGRGFLLATPDGTVTPYGMMIYAGSPSIVPPTRPGTSPVAPSDTDAPSATDEPAAAPEADAAATGDAAQTLPEASLDVLAEVPVRPDARLSTAGALNAANISLDGLRPPPRPDDAVPDDLLPAPPTTAFSGPRPAPRPDGLAPEETSATPAVDIDGALAGILDGAADPLASATSSAVARSVRPDNRPNNFDRVVQQARARQSRAAQSAPAAAEPDAVSSAAAQPSGPVPRTVASAATQENAINLRRINLIGVYGRPNDRRALVRLSNGRYVRVGVGDRLDGGRVAAINDNALNYVKSGRTVTLEIPRG